MAPASDVQFGSEVISVGYPASAQEVTDETVEPTNKDGTVSAKRTTGGSPVYEVSAAHTAGMSGGPSVDHDGGATRRFDEALRLFPDHQQAKDYKQQAGQHIAAGRDIPLEQEGDGVRIVLVIAIVDRWLPRAPLPRWGSATPTSFTSSTAAPAAWCRSRAERSPPAGEEVASCGNCGTAAASGAGFCAQCGASLETA